MNSTTHSLPPGPEPAEHEIRERAYFLWLERGALAGTDWEHWFAAKQELMRSSAATSAMESLGGNANPSRLSIQQTLAERLPDPGHRFHSTGPAHDNRTDVVAGEARQRVRGRHFDGSLRPQKKKSK